MCERGRHVGRVEDRGEQGDGDVREEEMGFVEAVVQEEELGFREGATRRWEGFVFVDVGRSEMCQVGIVDPAGNALVSAGEVLVI